MMLGKYSDVILAYNPLRPDDKRSELLFKVTYQQANVTLQPRIAGAD